DGTRIEGRGGAAAARASADGRLSPRAASRALAGVGGARGPCRVARKGALRAAGRRRRGGRAGGEPRESDLRADRVVPDEFQAGHQLVADRDSHLSCLPCALLLGAAVGATLDAATSGRLRRPFAAVAIGVVAVWITGLASLTWFQVQIWRDSGTLWRSALDA